MALADPAAELLRLVVDAGDPPIAEATPASMRAAHLIRRRFGLALPPPFAAVTGGDEPVRRATAADGAAIAAVKWRCFGANYRGVLDDSFLDDRGVVPPASFWIGRAMVPPSRRHALFAWGRPGTVLGYVDCGPAHAEDRLPGDGEVGEVYELYVDPAAQGAGGGALLLGEAVAWLAAAGFDRLELSVIAANESAQGFYAAHGWVGAGEVRSVDLGVVAFEEVRLVHSVPGRPDFGPPAQPH